MESIHRIIHVAGDYIAQQHIEVQVNNVASGAIGAQIIKENNK